MVTSVGLMLALANLAWGQAPGVVRDPPSSEVEIIQPGPVAANASSEDPPEAHAPELAEPSKPRIWVRAEYLLWFNKVARIPPLITSGLTTDKLPGALDNPNTRILYGGGVDFLEHNGGRFSLGYNLDDAGQFAVEGSFLFLGERVIDGQQISPGSPVLGRPFFDVVNNQENVSLVSYPGLISGSVSVRSTNLLGGAEGNFTMNVGSSSRFQVDALAGFRYWRLEEDLSIDENTQVNPGSSVFAGNTIRVNDYFGTDNSFYGGQFGLRGRFLYERLQLQLTTKLALGSSQEAATIRGATYINTLPATSVPAGFLALASNSGRFNHNEFTAIPEIGINLGFRVTDHIQLVAGYTFMYWANVLRPGDQIDTNVNPNLIPTSTTYGVAGGPARPALTLHESSFWAQGLNVGFEVRY